MYLTWYPLDIQKQDTGSWSQAFVAWKCKDIMMIMKEKVIKKCSLGYLPAMSYIPAVLSPSVLYFPCL